jgi:hypothetical protein
VKKKWSKKWYKFGSSLCRTFSKGGKGLAPPFLKVDKRLILFKEIYTLVLIMKPTLQPVLALINANERDQYIQFFEEDHKYLITFEPDVKYTSVTTWNHKHFTEFNADAVIESMMKGKGWKEGHKYWGLTSDQIKAQWNANGSSVSSGSTVKAVVKAEIVSDLIKGDKVIAFKMKRRKGFRKKHGHRTQYTHIKVTAIA